MTTHEKPRGITLPEALAVLAVLTILTVILFPVLTRNHPPKYNPAHICLTNVRQIAVAVEVYVQENGNQYPGKNWAADIESYTGTPDRSFSCPGDGATNMPRRVSYGYSGLLLKANGSGVSSDQVINPMEVGVICDAAPVRAWPGNGIVYGGGLLETSSAVTPAIRHYMYVSPNSKQKALVLGYCDGHARVLPCTSMNARNFGNEAARALVRANGMGYLDNPAGGVQNFISPATLEPADISLGGDPCTRSILLAAAQVWQAKSGASYSSKGFLGQDIREGRTANYLWGIGDGISPGKNALPIARDAMLIIVSKNCKIRSIDYQHVANAATIRRLFAMDNAAGSAQAYTFDEYSGSRRFFTGAFTKLSKEPLVISDKAGTVSNDTEMMHAVAYDPYAIGYCSSAFVNTEWVKVLDIVDDQGRTYKFFNRGSSSKMGESLVAQVANWPFMRTLYVAYGGKAWRKDGSGIVNVMLDPDGAGTQALHDGPLFKGNYYLPE